MTLIRKSVIAAALGLAISIPAQATLSQNQVFEIRFMEDMIDHHARGADMATLCLARAGNAELLSLCDDIAKTQRAEIAKMQGWLRDWYGETSTPHKTAHSISDMKHLASLSGGAFEQEFMQRMSGHHMTAIEQSAQCLLRTSHHELNRLCGDIIRTQTEEIQKMRVWLCKWYEACSLHVMRGATVGVPQR